MRNADGTPRWTFLTNHGHVLLLLARTPRLRLRDVAGQVGVTERAVQRIVADLEEAGYLTRRRTGRQNAYKIDLDLPMRHPVEASHPVRALLMELGTGRSAPRRSKRAGRSAQAGPRSRTSS